METSISRTSRNGFHYIYMREQTHVFQGYVDLLKVADQYLGEVIKSNIFRLFRHYFFDFFDW